MSLEGLFADHQLYHSDWQIDHFILSANGGTIYGRYKQALRELHKRYRGLKGLYAERALLEIDIEELADVESKAPESPDARRHAIRLAQKRMALDGLQRNIRDTEREFLRFYAHATMLKEQVGELTPERRAELDRDMWLHQIKAMAAADIMALGHLNSGTVNLLMAIPVRRRAWLWEDITRENGTAITRWAREHEAPMTALPELPPEMIDVQHLLTGG